MTITLTGFIFAQTETEWNWRQVSTGTLHTVAIRTDGTLWAWGDNSDGRLGDGTVTTHHPHGGGINVNNNRRSPIQIGTESNWAYVSAGGNFTVGIRTDGTLWAWGNNEHGRLGDGTATTRNENTGAIIANNNRSTPVRIGTATNWVSVSAGNAHSVAMRTDGTLWAWGNNWSGRLGDGTTTHRNAPVRIGTVWAYASAGWEHTVGISRDGSLWAWGSNSSGQLGDGTGGDWRDHRISPVRVGRDTDWASASAGRSHTVAIKTDGTLWAWGNNEGGRLGDGTTTNRNIPVQIGPLPVWASVTAGMDYTLAVRTNGTLWAWGINGGGRLGDGSTTNRNTPVRIGTDSNWASVSAGGLVTGNDDRGRTLTAAHTMAIRTDGTLWAWGNNGSGRIGDGTTNNHNAPVQIGTGPAWIAASVSAGVNHTLAIGVNGTLWAWGNNEHGQLGNGRFTTFGHFGNNNDSSTPVQIGTDINWKSVSVGVAHSVALKTDGTLWAWGLNNYGQLGSITSAPVDEWGRVGENNQLTPLQIGNATNWTSVSAGRNYAVAIKTDGTLWAWGNNSDGQLGDGTRTNRSTPVQIGTDTNWKSVSAGVAHTVAIRTDGTLWAWGWNGDDFRLGTAWEDTFSAVPVQVGTDANWVSVSTGYRHTIALRTDGSLWAWGFNQFGQLGDGTTTNRFSPTRVGTDNNWASVSAAGSHTLAIRTDDSVWVWGSNQFGQLGDGTTTNRNAPVRIQMPIGWFAAAISAGNSYTIAVGKNGNIFSWGSNGFAGNPRMMEPARQNLLGIGSGGNRNTPVQVRQ